MDFKNCLEQMTARFRDGGGKITLPRDRNWNDKDAAKVYDEFPTLLRDGRIFYSCVVQANSGLFEGTGGVGSAVSAGMVIFNQNRGEPSLRNPEYMVPFAHYLFMCKKKEPSEVPEWLGEAVETVRGNSGLSRVVITADGDESYSMNLTLQGMLIFRQHLLRMRLGGGVVPIVAAPEKCSSVFVLPHWFWGKEFSEYWLARL